MADNNTIVLKGIGHHDEGVAGSACYPGEAVRLAADSKYDPEPLAPALATGRGLKLAKEDALQGKTTADAYALDDILFFYSPVNGDHVQVLVKSGEDVDVGDILIVEGSGSGKFVEASSSATAAYPLPLTDARVHDDLGELLPKNAIANETVTKDVPLTDAKVHDAMATDLGATASADDMGIITGTPGTDAPTLQGVDFGSASSDEKCAFDIVLPADYVAGESLTVRVRAGMLTTVADTSCTLDVEAWETDGDGAVGSDICATAAQSINSLTLANKDFTITPTGLAAGDHIIVRLSFAGTDTGNAGVMVPEIQKFSLIYTSTVLSDDMAIITGTPGTDAPTLQGADFGGTSTNEKCAFEAILPRGYRAGQPVTVRVRAAMLTTVSDTTATVDVEAWEADGDGAVGADLCTTAAQSINSLTRANKDFTITPTNLAAGDKLLVRVSFAGSDTGDAGVMTPEISNIELRIGDAVDGQLEALEDSGGALAAATLIKCRVLNP